MRFTMLERKDGFTKPRSKSDQKGMGEMKLPKTGILK